MVFLTAEMLPTSPGHQTPQQEGRVVVGKLGFGRVSWSSQGVLRNQLVAGLLLSISLGSGVLVWLRPD